MQQGTAATFDEDTCTSIVKEEGAGELEAKWFGRRGEQGLILSLVETAYLLLSEKIQVSSTRGAASDLNQLVSLHQECFAEFFWPMLTVYKDLRDRGRRVKPVGRNSFLVRDKQGGMKLVYVLEEKHLEKTSELMSYVEAARSNSLETVFAVVSLQGDLTYYEVSRINPVVE
ncbi:MAG: endonuclease [Thermosphaera sp.]